MDRSQQSPLAWQSKGVLLAVLPLTAAAVILEGHWWATEIPEVAWTAGGISAIFGLIVWRLRAGTPGAAATGALITCSLMLSTARFPYHSSWAHGALLPLLAVFLLTFAATRAGRTKKEALGLSEDQRGRNAAQVAANLGAAALVGITFTTFFLLGRLSSGTSFAMMFASVALAEAAADTVSSEVGQAFGGQPRMLTTLRSVPAGTDGAITLAGTAAGILAACVIAVVAAAVERGSWFMIPWIVSGAVFGLLIDSLLGATLERKGWLNNDAVNFLSTLSSVLFVLLIWALRASFYAPVQRG